METKMFLLRIIRPFMLSGLLFLFSFSLIGQYVVDFEHANNGNKIFYALGEVNLNGINWELEQTLIGSHYNDKKNGLRALRMKRNGNMPGRAEMLADLTDGVGAVTFELAKYSKEINQADLNLQYSVDQGSSWVTFATFSEFPDELTTQSVLLNEPGNVRLRFITELNGTNERRLNIDDLIITSYNDPQPVVNLFPASGFGTLAFEDLWPARGDYDFNDLVVDYQFEITANVSNYLESLKATFVIKAFGASYENGFGFQLSGAINPADITVSGYSLTENYIMLNENGTETGQSKPTIIVFDNAYNEMDYASTGIGVNTQSGQPYVEPKTLEIIIGFAPGTYTTEQLDISNFNPFLIVNKNRAVEVHLPNYPPTDLADQSSFGQWDDASNPALGKYYVSEGNLPWAINIYESFDYPVEKQDIVRAHLKFSEWASSGGILFPNWFRNLTGFRNNSLIYVP